MSQLDFTRITDELDAVNYVLAAVSLTPVTSLEGTQNRAVKSILELLRANNKALQTEGWSWNTTFAWVGSPNISGEIELPANTLKLKKATQCPPGVPIYRTNYRVTRRGRADGSPALFNADLGVFTFDNPISLEITEQVNFDSLPEAARQWIVSATAKEYNANSLNDRLINTVQGERLSSARVTLEQTEDAFAGNHNMVASNTQIQSMVRPQKRRGRRGG